MKVGGEKLDVTLSGGANCGDCNSEGTVIPVHVPPEKEGGEIIWRCTACGHSY